MKIEYGDLFVVKGTKNRYVVSKYWDDDTDANKYKIKLRSVGKPDCYDSYYSIDFISLWRAGQFEKVED